MFKTNSVNTKFFTSVLLMTAAACLPVSSLFAQGLDGRLDLHVISSDSTDSNESETFSPLINIERRVNGNEYEGVHSEQTVDMSLGLTITPVKGLNLRADTWKLKIQDPSNQTALGSGWGSPIGNAGIETPINSEFTLIQPFTGNNIESNGIELGASYIWKTDGAGQFSLSSTATYVNDFNQASNFPEIASLIGTDTTLSSIPDLQSSLTLTWQFGNHSASAITNYFESFKDLDELNIEEINTLVDNITTFDLRYGYQVKTGKQEKAVISFGIRNIFDKKTTQILNQNSRVIDQDGRVAYGSIKYQF